MMRPNRSSAVKSGIEAFERKCQPQTTTGKTISTRRNDEFSATTTASSYSTSKPSESVEGTAGSESKKESLLGTCVSFTDEDECSETTSYTQPTAGSHGGEGEDEVVSQHTNSEEESENGGEGDPVEEDCSEDALMAVIAAATAKKEETSYAAFFASAEAEAIAAAEEMVEEEECHEISQKPSQHEGCQGMRVVDDLFERIENQIGKPEAKTNTPAGVTEVLQDLERVLFFTDVIDRNPAPPSSSPFTASFNTNALMPSSFSPWWEAKVREVSDAVYKSSVEAYNEIERTSNEVQRIVLFTDVPDSPDGDVPAKDTEQPPLEPTTTADAETPKPYAFPELALFSSSSTKTGKAESQMEEVNEKERSPEEQDIAEEKKEDTSAAVDNFNQELSRMFKGLEQKLFFTDLPDVPLPPSTDRSQTASMALSQTTSGQSGTSVKSALDLCRANNSMLTNVYTEQEEVAFASSDIKERLLKCVKEENPEPQFLQESPAEETNSIAYVSSVDSESFQASVEQTPEEYAPAFEGPQLSDLSTSCRGSPKDRLAPSLSKCSVVEESSMASDHKAEASVTSNRDESVGPSVSSAYSSYAEQPTIFQAPAAKLPSDLDGNNQAVQVLKTDSSTEKSVRLLVEVKVNKSYSESATSDAMIQNDTMQSGTQESEAAGEDCQDEPNHSTVVRSWNSSDEQNLAHIMDSTTEEGNKETTEDHVVVSNTSELEEMGPIPEESSSKASSGFDHVSWEECASSMADTYATAVSKSFSKQAFSEDCGNISETYSCSVPQDVETSGQAKENSESNPITPDSDLTREEEVEATSDALDAAVLFSNDTFDILLAEMKDLETAINSDLQRAQKVLCKASASKSIKP